MEAMVCLKLLGKCRGAFSMRLTGKVPKIMATSDGDGPFDVKHFLTPP